MTARAVLVEDRRDDVIEGDNARRGGRLRPAPTSSSGKAQDEQQENCADAHEHDHKRKRLEARVEPPAFNYPLTRLPNYQITKLPNSRSRSSLRSPRSAAS